MQHIAKKGPLLSHLLKCFIVVLTLLYLLRQSLSRPSRTTLGASQKPASHQDHAPSVTERSRSTFQIVIAHKDARPHMTALWLDQVRDMVQASNSTIRTTFYTQGRIADFALFKNLTRCNDIHQLHGRGRAVGTFLHHIVLNYESLANFTFFTYDQPVGLNAENGKFDEAHTDALWFKFGENTGFLNHGLNEKDVGWCTCGECDGREGYSFPFMSLVIPALTGKQCQGRQRTVLFNQFIVSRGRILSQPKWVYHLLLDLVTAPDDHWVHQQQQPREILKWMGGRSTAEQPLFLYTIERLWSVLFGCADDPWAQGCVMFLNMDGPA